MTGVVQQYVRGLDRGRPHSIVSALEWNPPRDGTGDASTPLSAAIAYLSANENFSTLVIPPGEYRVPEAVHLKSNVQIVGSGRMNTILKAVAGGDYSMESPVTRTAIVGGVNVDDVEISGIGVDANGESGVSGICIFGGLRPNIHDCMAKNHGGGSGSGIQFFGEQQTGVDPVYFGTMQRNYVENYVWCLVMDGYVVSSSIVGNVTYQDRITFLGNAASHISCDGNEASGSGQVYGATISGNVGRGGREGVAMNVAEGAITGNSFYELNYSNSCLVQLDDFQGVISGNRGAMHASDSKTGSHVILVVNSFGSRRALITGNTYQKAESGLTMQAAGKITMTENEFIDVDTPKNLGAFSSGVVFERNYADGTLIT